MILPNKYIKVSESLLGLSALLLDILSDEEMGIDELWKEFKNNYNNNPKLKYTPTYNKFVLSINFMYLTNMINYNEKGGIYNENIESKNIQSK